MRIYNRFLFVVIVINRIPLIPKSEREKETSFRLKYLNFRQNSQKIRLLSRSIVLSEIGQEQLLVNSELFDWFIVDEYAILHTQLN